MGQDEGATAIVAARGDVTGDLEEPVREDVVLSGWGGMRPVDILVLTDPALLCFLHLDSTEVTCVESDFVVGGTEEESRCSSKERGRICGGRWPGTVLWQTASLKTSAHAQRSPFLPDLGGRQFLYVCSALPLSPLPHVLSDEIVQDSFRSSHLGNSEDTSSWAQSNCLQYRLVVSGSIWTRRLTSRSPWEPSVRVLDTKEGGAEGGAGRGKGSELGFGGVWRRLSGEAMLE
ncbi:unnamed protein product [Rangifer tarandus platyrhynchus]|uniref:Uncharacterized protein n=2 Tax=Rangifer tarandus platyrhynchus TaxID=3082113 RepID=A0ABN8XZV9_RANTA|nr:unnamed protein product [Rangifer tarandus platyrhynchus]CAI9712648.1 unnamed protein product [Rangifer tarandus platyrhynchus]